MIDSHQPHPRAYPDVSSLLPDDIAATRPTFEGVGPTPEERLAYLSSYVDGARLGALAASVTINQEHEQKVAELKQQALTDPLTGLPNGAGLAHAYEALRKDPNAPPSALAFIDIDRFKALNERFGHDSVDDLLTVLAPLMAAELRDTDVLGRRSGDEFIALLQGVSPEQAEQVMERVAGMVGTVRRYKDVVLGDPLTLSIGIVPFDGSQPYETVTRAANELMRDAKATGRDKIVVADAA